MELTTILYALITLAMALTGRGIYVLTGALNKITTLSNTNDTMKKSQTSARLKRDILEGIFHLGFVATILVTMFSFAVIGGM